METKKVNITLTLEQYDLLEKALCEALLSLHGQIADKKEGGEAPNLEKCEQAYFELREDIKGQRKTQQ